MYLKTYPLNSAFTIGLSLSLTKVIGLILKPLLPIG